MATIISYFKLSEQFDNDADYLQLPE